MRSIIVLFLSLLLGHCLSGQTVTLSGQVTSVDLDPLEGILVRATDGPNNYEATTNASGVYSIDVPAGAAYFVRPCAMGGTTDPLNGLTTLDLVQIANHYNGTTFLGSPYQIIAADVDRSTTIDFQDSLQLRMLVLGIWPNLPDSIAWRFVPADYQFPDPGNPFVPHFPEFINTGVVQNSQSNLDFFGIRIGDVNLTAQYEPGSILPVCGNLPSHLSGYVRIDENNNCIAESTEPTLGDWVVKVSGPAGTFFRNTNHQGFYALLVPPGTYTVSLIKPNNLWGGCILEHTNVVVDEYSSVMRDFSVRALSDCPQMDVSLSTPFLRRCFNNVYQVSYCNKGTVVATDVTVDVTLDPFLTFISSPATLLQTNGNTYTFSLPDVAPGECGKFTILAELSCDAGLGQTHCSSAHIYPDDYCTPLPVNWDGATLTVNAECQSGEAVFTITNDGASMTDPVGYVVIEDIMIQMVEDKAIQLGSGESTTVSLPANGSTWRLEVEQSANHPFQSLVSAALEGCGTKSDGSFTTGLVEQFPENDELPFEDEDCRANLGAYDPNDKTGYPLGVQAARYIPFDQPVEYLIRFQNTGTDTAFNVVILDTLSALFDPATIKPLNSSHPYTFNLLDNGVLQFAFSNIMLPDSNVNEPASHGFVKFVVSPVPGLSNGTVVENSAGIYFDFNEPVITNKTYHTYGREYLSVGGLYVRPGVELSVFPNPAKSGATFVLENAGKPDGTLCLFNAVGQEVRRQRYQSGRFQVPLDDLQPGVYWFRLETGGQLLGAGRLVIAE